MEVYLIRHTRPDIEKGICYGQSDIGLAATFEEEKKLVLSQLPPSFDIVFTSPLKRCSTLALCLQAPEHQRDKRLMELNFGSWEMRPWENISRHELDKWGSNYLSEQVPGGESYLDLKKRLHTFWHEVKALKGKNRIAVVSHKGIIQSLLHLEGLLNEKELFVKEFPYGGIEKIGI